jgi:hypothetical protein
MPRWPLPFLVSRYLALPEAALARISETITMNKRLTHHAGPRFKVGRILATQAALDAIADARVSIGELLTRHICGDFGELAEFNREQNVLAIATGQRILSSYVLSDG